MRNLLFLRKSVETLPATWEGGGTAWLLPLSFEANADLDIYHEFVVEAPRVQGCAGSLQPHLRLVRPCLVR